MTHTFRAYRLANLMAIYHKRNLATHFYGWECVSLKFDNRTLDFVIEDERDLQMFIQAMEVLIFINKGP